ncbi:MAG: hypothetical protein KBA61_11715 [Spirochaetes bacterium]|nr:hypothetical protein [Spirochaetota bacterium]
MGSIQTNLAFDDPRKGSPIAREDAVRNVAADERVALDGEIRKTLTDYVRRYAADDALIEIKGKLIQFIRGI